jgi:hypothetical protein
VSVVERSQFKNETIVKAALKHLFGILTTNLQPDFPNKLLLTDFLDKCRYETNSAKVQDQAAELQLLLNLDWSNIKDLQSEKDFSQDFTMSYLDGIVVSALEQGAPVYDPHTLSIPDFQKNRSRSPSLRFTPYNVMEESEWRNMSLFENKPSSSTTGSLKNTPEVVWSMTGRAKKEADEGSNVILDINEQENVTDTGSEIQAAVIQDLSQWS